MKQPIMHGTYPLSRDQVRTFFRPPPPFSVHVIIEWPPSASKQATKETRENHILFGHCPNKSKNYVNTQLFSGENWFQCVKCLVKWHLSNNSREKRNVKNAIDSRTNPCNTCDQTNKTLKINQGNSMCHVLNAFWKCLLQIKII